MTKLNGRPWNELNRKLSNADKERLKCDLARYVAEMHKITGDYFGYMKDGERFHFASWREAYCGMLQDIMADAKRDHIRFPYKKVWAAVEPHLQLLDEVKTPALVNYDFWAGNIFLTDESGQYEIEGLIDHERGFWGDPYAEFASSAGVYRHIKEEAGMQAAYAAQSGKPFVFTRSEEIRIELYHVYGSLLFGAEVYRYPKIFAFFQLQLSKFYLRRNLRTLKRLARMK